MYRALSHFASVVVAIGGEADEADELLQHTPLRKRTWHTVQDVGVDQDGGHVVLKQEVQREIRSETKVQNPTQSVDCGFERFDSTNDAWNLMDFGLLVKENAVVQGHKVGGNIWAGGNVIAKYRKQTDQTIAWGKHGHTIWYGEENGFHYNNEKSGTDHKEQKLDPDLWSSIEAFVTGRTFDESCRVFDFDEEGGNLDAGASVNPYYRVLVVNQDTHFTDVPQEKPEWGHANHRAGDSSKFFTMTTKCQKDPDIYFRSNEYAEKGENTLVIFTGSDTVVLGKATEFYDGARWHNGGFKWGATVIAPFAKVICWADNTGGPCNGAIVARGLGAGTDSQNVRGQSLGGEWYTGRCPDVATPSHAALPPKPDPVCLECTEPRTGQPSVAQLSKPYCHAVVSSGTCTFSAATVKGPVYCEGNLKLVGDFDKHFDETVYVANPGEGFLKTNLDEDSLLANKNDVGKTFPEFVDRRLKYSAILDTIRNNPQTLQDDGWRPFGDTNMSFWKRNPNWKNNEDNAGEAKRLVVHIVDRQDSFPTNYKQVLQDSGLGYQVDVDNSKTYRWCETEWKQNDEQKTRCKKNGNGEIYIDEKSGSNTLVVFTKAEQVSLTKTPKDQRKWGPTVFAPDTDVKVETQAVYGQLIVKNLLANELRTGDHFFGKCFTEPLCLG